MKRKIKKLSLNRETLGNLEESQMKVIVGGTIKQTDCTGCVATDGCTVFPQCTATICSVCCP